MHEITRSCVLFLWIQTLTFVKSQNCTREQFVKSHRYDSNFDITSMEHSYSGGRQVRVSCNIGFSGFFRLICVEGKWQFKGANCQPRSCGHPGDTQFADFHLEKGEDFVFGSKVVYTCQKGYQMVSRINYRHCMAEGWDGVVPVCEAQRCQVIHVADSVQVNGDPEDATYGNVVRFSCKSNTEILVGSPEIYCDENGDWSALAPKCQAIECTVPLILNGYIPESKTKYKEHEILHYRCDRFYKPLNRPSKCTKVGNTAEFSPTPVCEEIKCRLPLTPVGVTRYDPAQNVFSPGETVRVFCSERYWVFLSKSTSALSTCNDNGEWEPSAICQEIRCSSERPPHVNSWDVYRGQIVRLDQTVNYRCTEGYKKKQNWARCTRDGWTPKPLCEDITCNRRDIENADIVGEDKQTYKYREQARYACKDGYEGQVTLTCGRNGWTGRSSCTEKGCVKPHINNARITYNDRETYRHNEQLEYTCGNDQRRFRGSCLKGKWTGIQDCKACADLEIANGFAVAQDDDKLFFTCNEGYKLFTKGWWGEATCIDRQWSGVQECIENSQCGEIPVIPNAAKRLRTRQEYPITCEDGYRAQVPSLPCIDGNWHLGRLTPETICTPVSNPCKPPPRVKNAVIMTSYQKEYLSDSAVTYQCHDKFRLEGENQIRCKDGQWEEKNIKCTPLTALITPRAPAAPKAPEAPAAPAALDDPAAPAAPAAPEDPAAPEAPKAPEAPEDPKAPEAPAAPKAPEAPAEEQRDIENADIVGEDKQTYKYREQARYSCKDGYEGQVTLTCGRNGLTGRSSCTEKGCVKPHINNARITYNDRETYRHNEQLEYTCGNDQRRFTVFFLFPACADLEIANGFAVAQDDDKLFFTCNEGYKLFTKGWWGEATCIDRQWSGVQECIENSQCGEIPVIPNAVKRLRTRQEYPITCEDGYRAQVPSLPCIDGNWHLGRLTPETICTPVSNPCKPPPRVKNAVIMTSYQEEYLSDSAVTYQCHDKFRLEGENQIRCKDGQWEEKNITCTQDCGCGKTHRNSARKTEFIEELTSVRLWFVRAQLLVEMRRFLILLFLQLWGNVKVCLSQRDCSSLPNVLHASVSEETRRAEYPPGHVIHFTCETGYVSGPTIRYICSNEGWLAVHEGTCYLKPCELPDDTPNGYYEIIRGDDFVFGATIRYFCNKGYQMVSKDDTRTCLLNKWTNHMPICEPLSCDPPSEDERIRIKGLSENQDLILPDRFLTFSCDAPGTYLNGSSVLICGHDGKWDNAFPTCEDIICTPGTMPPHLRVTGLPTANETMKVGHKLQFECNDRHALEGPEEIECLQTGQWNVPFPKCTEKCEITGELQSVRITTRVPSDKRLRKGEKITFTCRHNQPGHVLRGHKTVECLEGGQWSDSFPTCGPPSGCERPPLLADGDIKGSVKHQYGHNEKVEYVCQSLHTMNGSPFKTCNNGEWTGQMKCLRPCTVDAHLMNRNNIRFRYVADTKLYAPHDDAITFTCTGSRSPVGRQNMRQVCTDGVMNLPQGLLNTKEIIHKNCCVWIFKMRLFHLLWLFILWLTMDESLQQNVPSDCERPPPLADGDIKGSMKHQYGHNERVEYVCQSLHTMNGSPFKTCNNGEWTGQMKCLRPCTVDADLMNKHNIRFRYNGHTKLYAAHDDAITFSCTGSRSPVGRQNMRGLCNDGVMNLPLCL
uniref:complement factor H-like n=1 Tax=Semicossyphus pulcher TaxID=241346 RepID=UPI0037E938B2